MGMGLGSSKESDKVSQEGVLLDPMRGRFKRDYDKVCLRGKCDLWLLDPRGVRLQ